MTSRSRRQSPAYPQVKLCTDCKFRGQSKTARINILAMRPACLRIKLEPLAIARAFCEGHYWEPKQ